MNKENREQRQEKIIGMIRESEGPVSASVLAAKLHVSRQVIVGDVALLRAGGAQIQATPNGYILEERGFGFIGTLACVHHDEDTLLDELYTVVDFGGTVIDVSVEHSTYGQISGGLEIHSRLDADQFIQKLREKESKPLSGLTGGIHLHRIGCRDEAAFRLIREELIRKGIALS